MSLNMLRCTKLALLYIYVYIEHLNVMSAYIILNLTALELVSLNKLHLKKSIAYVCFVW